MVGSLKSSLGSSRLKLSNQVVALWQPVAESHLWTQTGLFSEAHAHSHTHRKEGEICAKTTWGKSTSDLHWADKLVTGKSRHYQSGERRRALASWCFEIKLDEECTSETSDVPPYISLDKDHALNARGDCLVWRQACVKYTHTHTLNFIQSWSVKCHLTWNGKAVSELKKNGCKANK